MQSKKGLQFIWGTKQKHTKAKELGITHYMVLLEGGNAAFLAEGGHRVCSRTVL